MVSTCSSFKKPFLLALWEGTRKCLHKANLCTKHNTEAPRAYRFSKKVFFSSNISIEMYLNIFFCGMHKSNNSIQEAVSSDWMRLQSPSSWVNDKIIGLKVCRLFRLKISVFSTWFHTSQTLKLAYCFSMLSSYQHNCYTYWFRNSKNDS